MTIEVIPNPEPIGAEVRGIDLSRPYSEAEFAQVRGALDKHGMIFIRNQKVPADNFLEFSSRFGQHEHHLYKNFLHPEHPEILILSNIVENGKPVGLSDAGLYWHTDGAYAPRPHLYTLLHGQEIPTDANGVSLGNTMFVSAVHAFKTLDRAMQDKLRPLVGGHSLAYTHARRKKAGAKSDAGDKVAKEELAAQTDVYHPVVWKHPRSGAECLYVNENSTFGFKGMGESEAMPLIEKLCAHITRPEAVYHHKWQPGDVIVWDNLQSQHKITADFTPQQRRRLHRTTVTGW